MRVLLIEDDAETSAFVVRGLADAQHEVVSAIEGETGLNLALAGYFDLLIVDRMLPGLDGLSLVRVLRERAVETPILFLTAMGAIEDRVAGLDVGADDYLVKPFSIAELIARVSALGRRKGSEVKTLLKVADLELDRLARTVRRGVTPIDLQPREFRLLEELMLNAGRLVTRQMLLEAVWRIRFDPGTNIVEAHMSRLRSKIDRGGDAPLIHTQRGEGYVIRP